MKSIFDEVINNEYSNVVDRFKELNIFPCYSHVVLV